MEQVAQAAPEGLGPAIHSTVGMVVGKLLSALAYVFLLIVASIPLMAIVFAFLVEIEGLADSIHYNMVQFSLFDDENFEYQAQERAAAAGAGIR